MFSRIEDRVSRLEFRDSRFEDRGSSFETLEIFFEDLDQKSRGEVRLLESETIALDKGF